jgi:hypothetical protein
LWIHLSETLEGQMVQQIVLPGNLTGRASDRYFSCTLMNTAKKWDGEEEWIDYLRDAIDHVDFVEIEQCSLDSSERQEAARTQ